METDVGERDLCEEEYARQTLERYSGSSADAFQSNLILTNFPRYVAYFAETRDLEVHEGSMFKVVHSVKEDISMLDFKIGSPAAALVIDLCSFLPVKSALLLGMCGGLRRRYKVGEYFMPVASIRAEGTSDCYFPPEVPSLSNFLMQKAVTEILEEERVPYHIGITFTSNLRFWEFNESFIERIKETKAQAFELECATLFMASYRRKFTLGALLLISDLPLNRSGVKTKKSSEMVFTKYMPGHIAIGVKMIIRSREMQAKKIKGAYRLEHNTRSEPPCQT